ncbi:MAG: multi antimicrobial extrusion protein MatE [Hirschia sp.]|mgnify:CR=1 FL=1|nr:multi antimicrobial extrusion protein MatE [Hirschia sp.]MBF17956.1 multi antimicrobial extrusion protein MatE [Hirschia sp.]
MNTPVNTSENTSVRAMLDLLKLAIPVIATRLTFPIMSVTDAVVLGHYAQLELAYITTGYLLFSIGLAFGMGTLQGVQVITAELSGVGRAHETGRVLKRGLLIGTGIGIVFTIAIYSLSSPMFSRLGFEDQVAADMTSVARILAYGLIGQLLATGLAFYFEALRRPNIVVAVMYGCAGLNLVIDLALVGGSWGFPQMGAEGVAWASTGVRVVQAVILIGLAALLTPGFTSSPPAPAGEFRRQNTVGMGGALANVAEFASFNAMFVIAAMISLSAGAVFSMAMQPLFTCFMVFSGIGVASSIRVAEAFGSKNRRGVIDATRLGLGTYLICGLSLSVIIFVFRDVWAGLLIKNTEEVNLVAALAVVIGISAIAMVFDGLQAVVATMLRAQEVVWPSTIIQLLSYICVMVPSAWYLGLVRGGGAEGVMWGIVFGSVVAGTGQLVLLQIKTARQ